MFRSPTGSKLKQGACAKDRETRVKRWVWSKGMLSHIGYTVAPKSVRIFKSFFDFLNYSTNIQCTATCYIPK